MAWGHDDVAPTPWQKTACIICSLNCGLEVQTEGRRIVRIRGDKFVSRSTSRSDAG